MKKLIALLLALSMLVCLTACGGGDKKSEGGKSSDPSKEVTGETDDTGKSSDPSKEVTGETYDAGNVSALVPEGWKAFPATDMWSDEENATDPDQLNIVKGGETEFDMLTKPYIQIVHYEPGSMMVPSKDYYDSAADVDPVTTGELTWEGFSAVGMLEASFIIMWTTNADGHQFQINIYDKTDEGTITLNDADVLAILASITNS